MKNRERGATKKKLIEKRNEKYGNEGNEGWMWWGKSGNTAENLRVMKRECDEGKMGQRRCLSGE